jgi:deoxyribodipyrimidine photolyase-related protein
MKPGAQQPILRLLLGDQLHPGHSWFQETSDHVVYLLMEIRQETDYVLHHAQKILGIFAAMRDFAQRLRKAGHQVVYLSIDDPQNQQSLPANLETLIRARKAAAFEYQAPDEHRLDVQLASFAQQANVPVRMVDTEHFYTSRNEAAESFRGRSSWLMERFYRQMRERHQILMEAPRRPVGGEWNFDALNRKPWKGLPAEPVQSRPSRDLSELWATLQKAGVRSFGEPAEKAFPWPINREEALTDLEFFLQISLPHFGDYQDAMSSRAWRMFHSLLSFALNTKMLNPREVIGRAIEEWEAGRAPLPAVEGFVRQILGWREFVRGFYWAHMPGYDRENKLGHHLPLPSWFWTGKTRMQCLRLSIGQSLEKAYAHHIQRLMVIGNFALLSGLDPEPLHRWYLGVYIDAFEWVELPNTLGMSQYADGGQLASKPYVSSAAYLNRMSDYCSKCPYSASERLGESACPFNSLYWDFFQRHQATLSKNPRLGIVYRQLKNMSPDSLDAITQKATALRANLESL